MLLCLKQSSVVVSKMSESIQDDEVLDLSDSSLKAIPRQYLFSAKWRFIRHLSINNNEFTALGELSNFPLLRRLTAKGNRLNKMIYINPVRHLEYVDLSQNFIRAIDGLKDHTKLTHLNLSNNKIRVLDMTLFNGPLEELYLSGNLIEEIHKLNHLSSLRVLHLDNNQLEKIPDKEYFPVNIMDLRLDNNKISDLTELTKLTRLPLRVLTLFENPCVTGELEDSACYRPYILNLFIHVEVLDNKHVEVVERLQAEWLYSQGRGHGFRPGQHEELVDYLLHINMDTFDANKMEHIFQKSVEHGAKLLPELSATHVQEGALMSQSLDSGMLRKHQELALMKEAVAAGGLSKSFHGETSRAIVGSAPGTAPLPAASQLVPVPESLVSPMVGEVPPPPPGAGRRPQTLPSSEIPSTSTHLREHQHLATSKLLAIKSIAEVARVRKGEKAGDPDSGSRSSSQDTVPGIEELEEGSQPSPRADVATQVPLSSEDSRTLVPPCEESSVSPPRVSPPTGAPQTATPKVGQSVPSPNLTPTGISGSLINNSSPAPPAGGVTDLERPPSDDLFSETETKLHSLTLREKKTVAEPREELLTGVVRETPYELVQERVETLERAQETAADSLVKLHTSCRLQVGVTAQLWNRIRELEDEVRRLPAIVQLNQDKFEERMKDEFAEQSSKLEALGGKISGLQKSSKKHEENLEEILKMLKNMEKNQHRTVEFIFSQFEQLTSRMNELGLRPESQCHSETGSYAGGDHESFPTASALTRPSSLALVQPHQPPGPSSSAETLSQEEQP